jgi:Transposase DDE domain
MIHTFEDLCTVVYVLVDELDKVHVQPLDHRPGPRAEFTESELLTVTLVAELIGLDQETTILGYLRRNHAGLFPLLPDRTRYNRRRRSLGEVLNTLRRQVLGWVLALLPPDERPLALIDSLPVPVVGFHHARGEHGWKGWASYGYNASKKQTIYGFKLHLLTTADGVIVDFVVAKAHLTDGTFTEQLLGDKYHLMVVGDKGYIDADVEQALAERQDIMLLTPKRSNQHVQLPPGVASLLSHFRQMIETVNSQLADQFHIETNKAKSMSGLVARLHAKLAAHTFGLYINLLTGRPLLDLKALALI